MTVNADLRLVTSNDYLTILKYGQTEPISTFEVAGFKNYNFFGVNHTINGTACYMDEIELVVETIQTQWIDKYQGSENSSWVLIIPFDNQKFVSNLEKIPKALEMIKGVIFTYSGNPQISSPAPDQNLPEIISFAKKSEIVENKVKEQSFPTSGDFYFEHKHSYIQYCDIMHTSFKFYITAVSLWGLITVFHILWTWFIKKDFSKHLQKIMLFVPIFFVGYTLIDYVYFMSCPWTTTSGVQYLQIVQIALVTIFNTLFVGLCCFISKGWSIMRNSFTREELSSITMIVGIFYLVYSAYFIASDIPSLKIVIIVILIVMYIWVALTWLKNCLVNIRTLKAHIEITNSDEIIMESLKLKKYLMTNFCVITLLFYTNKIIHSALKTFIENNTMVRDIIIVNLFIELIIISYMLFLFRSRKWPEYFGLDISIQRADDNDDQEQLPKSIILSAIVPAHWIIDNKSWDMTINGIEVNNFKNDKYRSPQVALLMNSADQEEQQLPKLEHDAFKQTVFTDFQLAIEQELSDSSDTE
jgi:hypothetical protein